MKIAYRQGIPEDAASLNRLFKSVFCDTFAHLYSPEDLAAFLAQFTVEGWRGELTNPDFAFHVAEEARALVGYAKLSPMKLPFEDDRPAILLSQLYVDEAHHGAGISHQLMDRTFAEAKDRGKERLYLTVFTENHRARRFYERLGFEAVGEYDFMVGKQADQDIIMRKTL